MRRGKTSVQSRPVRSVWDEWVSAFLLEERDAKGRRARTLDLHRENLAAMRALLDEVGAPEDQGGVDAGARRGHGRAHARTRAPAPQ